MRLALVVASSYKRSTRLGRLAVAEVDGRRVAERLSEGDARFVVEEIAPSARLASELTAAAERATESRAPSATFIYFSGYAEVDPEGELALVLDARRADRMPVAELARVLGGSDTALVMLDLVHLPDEDDPTLSATLVALARDALAPKETGIGLLVAARPIDRSKRVPSPLTHMFLRSLERVTPSAGRRSAEAVTIASLYEAMRADTDLLHELSALGFFRGRSDFPLLLPPSVVVSDEASRSEPPPRQSGRPPPRSVPPPAEAPTPHGATAAGDALAQEGRHEAAIDAYKRALLLSGSTKDRERAELYLRIGTAKRALGSDAEAVHNFDKALAIEPLHEKAFAEASKLLCEQKDFARLERLHRRRLEAQKTDDERISELREIARLWIDVAGDPKPAVHALEQWIAIRPDTAAYEKLVAAQDALGRPAAAVLARKALAERVDPEHRARLLAQAAQIVSAELPNKNEAVELARAALDADAGALDALEIAARELGKRRRWSELAELYVSVLDRTRDAQVAWDLAKKLGMLQRDELDDAEAAKRAFMRALEHDESDVELRYWLAEILEAERDHAASAEVLRAGARHAPTSADLYRRALWAFEKVGDSDAAWCAAAALDQMGEADINESLVADAHRPEGLPAVRSGIELGDWALFSPERDRELDELFALIDPAVRELTPPPSLEPSTRQDAEKSTATVARSLVWTCRLLGVPVPELHVVPALEVGVASAGGRRDAVMVARSLASGVELPDLAFLWGRQLWFHRPEHSVLLVQTGLGELARLLLAALAAGGLESDAVDDDVRALSKDLARELDDDAEARLIELARSMRTRGLRQRLVAWTRAVQLGASRAGLLACGDIARAAELCRRHPLAGVEVDEQVDDLRAWSVSAEHGRLRERIGVALRR